MSYYKVIGEMKRERAALDARMQADSELLYLEKYRVLDGYGKSVPGIIELTMNRPAVFAANVIASLNGAKAQIVVTSNKKSVDTAMIEDFIKLLVDEANRKLRLQGTPPLGPFSDIQFAIRGRSARRVLLYKDDQDLVCDIKPWDGRYVFIEYDGEGLKWAGYETMRLKRDVEMEYGLGVGEKAIGGENSVLDVWDRDKNEVWVDGDLIKTTRHSYGFTPVVYEIVSLGYGPALLDMNWGKREGESIFFMIRDIVPEMNRLASILQTLNMNELKAALQYKNPQGSSQDEPPERPEMGDLLSVGPGELSPISMGQARQAAVQLYNIMEKAFQEGSYTDIDIGNVRQPFSAVALITIGESRDMVFMPRLAAKELLNQAMAEMLIKQAIQIGGIIKAGNPGHETSFDTDDLKGQYEIRYKYFVKSPKDDVARMAVAAQAQAYYPRRKILDEILQDDNPDKTIMDRYAEMAEIIDPNVLRHRVIRALLEKGEVNNDKEALREAKIMQISMEASLKAAKMGQVEEAGGGKKPAGGNGNQPLPVTEPMVSLLGRGGQIGGTLPPEESPPMTMQE